MKNLFATFVIFASLCWTAGVYAQAQVQVRVGASGNQRAEGRVQLVALTDKGRRYQCMVRAGTCQISGVIGGRYKVRFTAKRGKHGPARKVMIPPKGTVQLRVAPPSPR